jgi:hypothetical protein
MRTVGLVCLITALAAAGGCNSAWYQSMTMDLEGAWSFDEASGETVGNAAGPNGGTIKGGLARADGKKGKAVAFDGAGYVLIDSADYLNATQYTFAAWVKLKDTSDYQYIVWRGGPEFPEPEERRNLDIWVTMEGTLSGILDPEDGGMRITIDGTAKVADDQWHHVVCVNDGKTVTFYVDGKKDGEATLSGPLATNDWPMWIGARPGDVAATGLIDEVRFYARALTPEQVAEME